MSKKIFIYDTTLRDGQQAANINYSLEDKLLITKKLDEFGIDYIEGGWPMKGVNTKDFEFFKKVKKLKLKHSKIVAFGSTRRLKNTVKTDENLNSLIEAGTDVITIFGKTWTLHVEKVLGATLNENLNLIKESISYLKDHKKEVIFDPEHFFDGYKENPEYALKCLKVAEETGADWIVLCDTNGGTLPDEIDKITKVVINEIKVPIGIHAHNDSGVAVANSLMAVKNGATQVQGTINGFGERTGNANLISIIPALTYKMGYITIPEKALRNLKELANYVYEIANIIPDDKQPYVGKNAFSHKAGVHAHAVMKITRAYEHIDPSLVGNERQILLTGQAGISNLIYKAKKLGYNLSKEDKKTRDLIIEIKKLEQQGYEFEVADATLKLFLEKRLAKFKPFFDLKGLRVIVEERDGQLYSEATIKIEVDNKIEHTAAEGDGPVNALDNALRKAIKRFYPEILKMQLIDFKVRVIEGTEGTAAKVRVLIESTDGKDIWTTVGVSENIIEASWQALVDSVEYKILKDRQKK